MIGRRASVFCCAMVLLGCDDATAVPNDDVPSRDSGVVAPVTGGNDGSVAPPPSRSDAGNVPVTGSDGGTSDGGPVVSQPDAAVSSDAGPAPQSKIAGTFQSCTTYTRKMGDKCASLYCNVTAADIAAETVPNAGPCSGVSPAFLCEGGTSARVGTCSRMVKSDPANLLDTKEMLRAKVEDCVYQDDPIKTNIPPMCLTCYLDAAACASDNCLTQCLAGDGPECDACRLQNNCNQPVPACAGLPSPF